MLITAEIVAKKYAIALLNTTHVKLSDKTLDQLGLFAAFLKRQKFIVALLALPTLTKATKLELIEKITTPFHLTALLTKLIVLLMEQKRIQLLGLVIKHLIKQYQKRQSISVFSVHTSHPLHEKEKQRIIDSISTVLRGKIQASFSVAPELISGIRIQSDTLLWERSVNKFLQRTKQITFQRAGL